LRFLPFVSVRPKHRGYRKNRKAASADLADRLARDAADLTIDFVLIHLEKILEKEELRGRIRRTSARRVQNERRNALPRRGQPMRRQPLLFGSQCLAAVRKWTKGGTADRPQINPPMTALIGLD
jgi:hypothetical protein